MAAGAGRPPIPTAIKMLRGNPGGKQLNPNEPVPAPAALTPPVPLQGWALELWQQYAPAAAAMGTFGQSDRAELAKGCRLEAQGWEDLTRPKARNFALTCLRQSTLIFNGFGLGSAVARTRISTNKPTPKSKWSRLIKTKSA